MTESILNRLYDIHNLSFHNKNLKALDILKIFLMILKI